MPLETDPNSGMRPQPPGIKDPPGSGGTRNPMRPQPPAIRDPRRADSKDSQWAIGEEDEDRRAREEEEDDDEPASREGQPDWEQRAKDAYRFSTTYLDSNFRQQLDDSLRAFNNQHPGDSKYNGENFKKRSKLFVPVTRTVIRKNEAAACKAFFSNMDVSNITAMNEGDPKQLLSAAVMKELIQYRLTHTIPWFRAVIGGIQDAQAQGACVYHVHWEYRTRKDRTGKTVVSKDQPVVDLKPLENFRFDPSANWMDPVNTSPYWIELIPMYVGDIKLKMDKPDPKGRQWKHYETQDIRTENPDDSTRSARLGNQQDPTQENRTVSDYDIAWVQRHIHAWDGNDWEFYTLNNGKLLTEPELLEKTVFHGLRPYVMGLAMLETHKVLVTPVPALVKPLQDAINGMENQRNDNVLLVLNKRFKVKRGTNVDTASLVRNVPGGITMVDNMEDMEELTSPDVTASSYQEEDRKRQAFDDLVGNFNPMQLHQPGAVRESGASIRMLQGPASEMTEYMLVTFAITGVIPVLRQLVLLEQHYETDATILAIAGQKAQVLQKFGIDKVTDEMLDHELTTNVNVGMGSTDPAAKLARFVYAVDAFAKICAKPPPGVNLGEVWKEICALSGYQDGERFSTQGNPEMAKLEQTIKQLTQMIQDLKRHKNDKEQGNVLSFVAKREANQTKEKIAEMQGKHSRDLTYHQHLLDQDDALLAHVLGKDQAEQQGQQQAQLSAQGAQQSQAAAEQQAKLAPKPANAA
jgi:metal-responsive CopG/Arc/MetJ family transcriptional regulator